MTDDEVDAVYAVVLTGTLAGSALGFLHIIDFELVSDTERQLLSAQIFLYGPAAAVIGTVCAVVHLVWWVRAFRRRRIPWWRQALAWASAFAAAFAGYLLLWDTLPTTFLDGWSEPVAAVALATAVAVVAARVIRRAREGRRATPDGGADALPETGDDLS